MEWNEFKSELGWNELTGSWWGEEALEGLEESCLLAWEIWVALQNLCHIHSLSWFAEPALLCHTFLVPKLAPSMWNSFLHLSLENTCWFFKTWVKCHTLWEAFPSSVLWALITFPFKHSPTQRLIVFCELSPSLFVSCLSLFSELLVAQC